VAIVTAIDAKFTDLAELVSRDSRRVFRQNRDISSYKGVTASYALDLVLWKPIFGHNSLI